MQLDPFETDRPVGHAEPYSRIAVLGAGAWGTALAAMARHAGAEVTLWGRDEAVLSAIRDRSENPHYLAGVTLPGGIRTGTDLADVVRGTEAVIVVVPSQAVREICAAIAPHLDDGVPVALCAKGIEAETGLLMTQIALQEVGSRPVGVVSGPTFAREVALGYPTAATVSFEFDYLDRLSPHKSPAARLSVSLTNRTFRTYISDDVIGVEIGGAIKNVIAIACGMMTGAGFAENTRAALITRGLDEMKRLAVALGGKRDTVMGLAGLGDLSLTCSSPTSRNMSFGIQLGQGTPRAACFGGEPVVVEGEKNAITVTDLARRVGLRLPICEAVRAVLFEGADLRDSFQKVWFAPVEAEPPGMEMMIGTPSEDRSPR